MHKPIDMVNQQYGRLNVKEYLYRDQYCHKIWLCKCECGNMVEVSTSDLRSGRVNSCGCYKHEYMLNRNTTHNKSKSRLYRIYHHMVERCYLKTCSDFRYYGARGIKVCNEWLNDFEAFYFWAMNNGYSSDLSIDRIDVNGDYWPGNCRWATMKTQNGNKRNTIYVEYNSMVCTLKELSEIYAIKYMTLYRWYRNGTIKENLQKVILKCDGLL